MNHKLDCDRFFFGPVAYELKALPPNPCLLGPKIKRGLGYFRPDTNKEMGSIHIGLETREEDSPYGLPYVCFYAENFADIIEEAGKSLARPLYLLFFIHTDHKASPL